MGRRIRELRMEKGLRQAELAEILGISASYLNLIEHDRRRIGTELKSAVAVALGIEENALAAEVDGPLVDRLLSSASSVSNAAELDRVAEFTVRYPGWARHVAMQAERIALLEGRVQELSDRMTYDPTLAASLHEVISTATAIRSTASILNGEEPLDADWQARFHKNIYTDAVRLADSSDALISYLEAPEEGEVANSPVQEAEEYLLGRGFYLAELEDGSSTPADLVGSAGLSSSASSILADFAKQYVQDAARLPMVAFEKTALSGRYDIANLVAELSLPAVLVARRLASLPNGEGHPPIGLITADAAGVLSVSKHLAGVVFPRSGACPLWPLYTSLGQPGRAVRAVVALPGAPETRISCFAISQQIAGGLGDAPQMRAIMLMMVDVSPEQDAVQQIGPTCRICPREGCSARREPTVIKTVTQKRAAL